MADEVETVQLHNVPASGAVCDLVTGSEFPGEKEVNIRLEPWQTMVLVWDVE